MISRDNEQRRLIEKDQEIIKLLSKNKYLEEQVYFHIFLNIYHSLTWMQRIIA